MNEQLEASFVSPIWIPKTLSKQAAETVAYNLVVCSMPAIRSLSYSKQKGTPEDDKEIPKDGREQEKRKNSMLNQLKSLKSWYWQDTGRLLGDCDSKARCIISKSLLDVIEISQDYWRTERLHKFIVQLLFSCEAGNLGDIYAIEIDTSISHQFSKFLIYMAPFYIRELHDDSFEFAEHFPVSFIILNSVDLRRIRLHRNIHSTSLDRLRINCRKAEVITFDFDNNAKYSDLVKDDNLFRTFFENRERGFVFQQMAYGNTVPQSFPNLKEVRIRCSRLILGLSPFIQCLFYSYRKVKIIVSCFASLPYDGFIPKYPFTCPTFEAVVSNDDERITCVYFCNEDLELNGTTGVSQTPVADANLFRHIFKVFASSTFYMQDILSMMQVCSLRYIFSDDTKIEISPCIALHADKLRVLYVFGPFPDEKSDEDLVESLNRCPRLEALFFTIKTMTSPVLEGLSLLNNLKILSVQFGSMQPCYAIVDSRFPHCLDTPLKEEEAGKFVELLIMAAPNLEVLEVPCAEFLLTIIVNGYLQKLLTLSVTMGDQEIIKDCIMNLSHLEYLLLDKFIDHDDYIELKRCFYYSKLQISYKRGRHVAPFII